MSAETRYRRTVPTGGLWTAGRAYLAHTASYPGKGTTVLTIKQHVR